MVVPSYIINIYNFALFPPFRFIMCFLLSLSMPSNPEGGNLVITCINSIILWTYYDSAPTERVAAAFLNASYSLTVKAPTILLELFLLYYCKQL